jgi:multimeric flavodoxin WrbA
LTKKIVGLSCGRKNSNSEHFLKAALMAAEEEGVETEIIRAMDHKVLPATPVGRA